MFYRILKNTTIYLIFAVILAGVSIAVSGLYAYRGVRAVQQQALIERVEVVALSINAREIAFLLGNESDLNNPFYQSIKSSLRKVKEANEDISYIYLAGKRDDILFFYVDAGAPGSDESLPGQTYEEASDVFKEVFVTGLPRFEGPLQDRWGNWVSAFVPITDTRSGEIIAVLGMDIAASEYQKRIIFAIAVPVLFIIILFLLFLVGYIKYKKDQEMLKIKARFLSIASHDLLSPLTGILWAIQSIQTDKQKLSASISETIDKMELAIKRSIESVNDILHSSQQIASFHQLAANGANVKKVIIEVMESLELAANQKNVALEIEKQFPENILARALPDSLRHIFSNIVSNAIKYSLAGGRVFIKCSKEKNAVIVSVEDAGIGIPAKDKKRIFKEYFRGSNIHSDQRGAGLGLYFTKQLVGEFGGKIWFSSKENMGTKFYIQIPKI